MIVASHHVLGTKIHERQDKHSAALLNIALVAFCDPMGKRIYCSESKISNTPKSDTAAREFGH